MSDNSRKNEVGSCLARIHARLHDKSKCSVRIAHLVLRSPDRARNMSIKSLAHACGTSAATITRFCKSLGYAGYKEFQLDMAAAIAQREPLVLDDFTSDASPETIIQRVFESNRQSLSESLKVLDVAALINVARLVQKAEKIFFLGLGGSGMIGCSGAERFMSLGLTAIAVVDPYDQIFTMGNTGSSDVVFGVSHTGQSTHITEALRIARRRGARTVALTNYPQSPLAEVSEFRLITSFSEHRINVGVSSSRIAQMCVIDSLYFIVASWGGRTTQQLADEAEKMAQKMLRFRVTGISS